MNVTLSGKIEVEDTLDEPMERIAIVTSRLGFISCDYSCSGHIADSCVDGDADDGYKWCFDGYLSLGLDERDERAAQLVQNIRDFVSSSDISDNISLREQGGKYYISLRFPGQKTTLKPKQMPTHEAEKIFQQFCTFWDDLAKMMEVYLNTREKAIEVVFQREYRASGSVDYKLNP